MTSYKLKDITAKCMIHLSSYCTFIFKIHGRFVSYQYYFFSLQKLSLKPGFHMIATFVTIAAIAVATIARVVSI